PERFRGHPEPHHRGSPDSLALRHRRWNLSDAPGPGDLVYIGSCSGTFFALDRRDGRLRWSQDVRPDARPTSFHGDALVADSLILIGTDAGTAENRHDHVWAFVLDGGAIRWKCPLEDGIVSDVVSAGSRVFAITRADSLLCLDMATGRRLWSFADSMASQSQFI